MTSIHEILFERPAIARRIEDDGMFTGWRQDLPRLWFLDERSATRLDAESLFGAQEYAVLYSRDNFTVVAAPVDVVTIGARGYSREEITVLAHPNQTPNRIANMTAGAFTDLSSTFSEEGRIWRSSGSPLNPVPGSPEGEDQRPL